MYFYSPSAKGFFASDVHGDLKISVPDPAYEAPVLAEGELAPPIPLIEINNPNLPADTRAVADDVRTALFAAQAEGKVIEPDKNGDPIAVDSPAPAPEEVKANFRADRNRLLDESQKLVDRHRDQKELNIATTLSDQEYTDLLTYRQALRDAPNNTDNHEELVMPPAPK